MARACAICGKKTTSGNNISHAHNVTKRNWKPNLQKVRAFINGGVQRIQVCTRCLRSGKVTKPPTRDWQPEAEAEQPS